MNLRTCVFPCAGFGTRFFPATKVVPKEMLPLVDKPILQYGIEEARDSGFDKLIIVTSKGKESILDHFDRTSELERSLRERQKLDLLAEVEKPKSNPPSRYAIIGRYILPPEIFPQLQKTPRGAGGEIQLTDAMRALVREGDFYGYVFEGKRYDAGEKLGYLKATVDFALRHEILGAEFREHLRGLMAEEQPDSNGQTLRHS